jgi:hypothetical protein
MLSAQLLFNAVERHPISEFGRQNVSQQTMPGHTFGNHSQRSRCDLHGGGITQQPTIKRAMDASGTFAGNFKIISNFNLLLKI